MIWGMFFPESFPLPMAFSFHFFQSGLSDGELIDMPQPRIPELPICHHSLYPSNLTCALLICQQLGMRNSALGEKSKELAFSTQPWYTRPCASLSHSIPVTIRCSRDVCHLCFTQRKLSLPEALLPKDEQFMRQKSQDLNQGVLALPDTLWSLRRIRILDWSVEESPINNWPFDLG